MVGLAPIGCRGVDCECYQNVTTAVKNMHGESGEFGVKVGVHQGSVLSPLLFTMVLEALSSVSRGFAMGIAVCE